MSGVSTFSGLSVALRGLLAEQRALDVTSHNIANINTPGYSRQTAVLTPAPAYSIPAGQNAGGGGAQLGQGVDVLTYSRSRDLFLDLQSRAAQMELGKQSTAATALGQAQSLLNEPGENGIAKLLGNFWTAWNKLSSTPEAASAKAGVLGAGKTLAGAIKQVSDGLAALQSQAGQQLTDLTSAAGPVQQGLQEIARLNTAIQQATEAGEQPNDLLDRRDLLLDELSTYAQVTTTDLGAGSIGVALDGQSIVAGSTFTWPAAYAATSGKLGELATLNGAGGPLAAYQADLDAVATTLVSTVNALQPTAFFSGTSASTFAVAAGASPVASGGAAGDNALATQLAALRGGAGDTAYAALVQRIAGDTAGAQRSESNAKAVAAVAEDRRSSVSGVSLDEEMTNLIRFQRGYQAAARVMSTMDEALDTLINRTGRVGL